jgi:Fe-S-cluster containining protein
VVSDTEAWLLAAALPEVQSEMAAMVAEAEGAVQQRRPVCVASGNCCHFERYGHALWLTGLEVAWCLRQLPAVPSVDRVDDAVRRGDCPFLREGKCSVHPARPLGCRAFFCDGAGQGWQEALLESWHGRVRALHERLAIPYRYDEWRRLLRAFASHA